MRRAGCGPRRVGVAALLGCGLWLFAGGEAARGVTEAGAGWSVHYNLPDGNTEYETSHRPAEYALRRLFLDRLGSLKHGDEALLATFTFSGDSACCGAAGPLLKAMAGALKRGASVGMAVGGGVAVSEVINGLSLAGLAAHRIHPLRLARDDAPAKLMHHKLAVLRYGRGDRRVIVTSWNFTGGASSLQWNIALELHHGGLHEVYRQELQELLAGRFHDHADKARAHDGYRFRLPGSWGDCLARFSPFADGPRGAPVEDLVNVMGLAQEEVLVAVPRLTLRELRDALIAAADRGCKVEVVLTRQEMNGEGASAAIVRDLRRRSSYKTANRVRLVSALRSSEGRGKDRGEPDLVHVKYLIVDPRGERPVVVHGSANWTYTALLDPKGNDENLLILRDAGIAAAFHRHFLLMTGRRDP